MLKTISDTHLVAAYCVTADIKYFNLPESHRNTKFIEACCLSYDLIIISFGALSEFFSSTYIKTPFFLTGTLSQKQRKAPEMSNCSIVIKAGINLHFILNSL